MQVKTAVKVISLYDLFDKNMFVIFSAIHHLIILLFNYYYIDYLDELIIVYPQYQPIFQQFQINIEFCQVITLVTAFILYFIPKMLFKYKFTITFTFTLDQIRCLIMIGSFIIKMIFTLYQIVYYRSTRTYDINNMVLQLAILEISYIVRFAIMIVMTVIIISKYSCMYLDKYINYISNWAKNYKVTYVEQLEFDNTKLDDV
jgi:hypothetical protein